MLAVDEVAFLTRRPDTQTKTLQVPVTHVVGGLAGFQRIDPALVEFDVVRAVPDPEAGAGALRPPSGDVAVEGAPAMGRIEIVLPGERRVTVDRAVDGPALARVIAVLERR